MADIGWDAFAREPIALVLDCNGLCHRIKHGIKRDLRHKGMSTEIIYGFLMQVRQYAARFNTGRLIFAWDSYTSKRRQRYSWYKKRDQKRAKSSEEIAFDRAAYQQFNELRRYVLPSIGFANIFHFDGFEADDIIARAVHSLAGKPTILVSRDEDMYQLLDYCLICNPTSKELFSKSDLLRKHGVTPEQWITVKKLAGCTSDTIPGIDMVGEKTAILWIQNKLKAATKRYIAIQADLSSQKSIAERNDWLVRLPLPETPELTINLNEPPRSYNGFLDVCYRYGFESFLSEKYISDWIHSFNLKEDTFSEEVV